MQAIITENRDKIIELCRRHHVRRLSVFGSAVRDDFDPEHSDMDFVVEFDPVNDRPTYEIQSILKDELVKLFSRPVDLIRAGTVRNPYIRQSIEEQQETLYAA